ncbi:MAG: pyruvate ferredoxin oxidoreductase [Planctomycetes bacterium RBG_16_43_13]|nr:MAG: pyruvate ferredoxin oxidoreductase [Planctomycetes bacterium RBG_16_43_13]
MSNDIGSKKFPYPGIQTTSDGAGAVVWVETHITDLGCAYPITPSTTMGTGYQMEVANGKKNLWGELLGFIELESEHSSASTCEGAALSGGRVTNFTSGQGLILMKEVLYTISGKRLPVVFHIAARALTSHSLNIHAGHDDVMGVADTGWGMLFAKNVQDACDLALIARRAAEDSETPFFNVQDGFLTTHTVEDLVFPEQEMMKQYIGNPREKLRNMMDPSRPVMTGVVQNQDSYMKGKISQRHFYDKVPSILQNSMDEFYKLTGRRYGLTESYRMEDAQYAIVGMGSMVETAYAAIDYIRNKWGIKVGALHVTSFRPFPGAEIVEELKNTKAVSILERMDNPIAQSNPLTAEIKAAFADAIIGNNGYPKITRIPEIFSGSAGLGSRDVRPEDFVAVVNNMMGGNPKRYFVIGIEHPLAIKHTERIDVRTDGAFSMRGHSVGGYGSVTTNKVIASMIGDIFGLKVQAYPKYGSEKKGLPTTYYLSAAPERIRTHCELEYVDFVAVNDINAFKSQNPLTGLSNNGTLFIHSDKATAQEVWDDLPDRAKNVIGEKNIRVFFLDTIKIARESATSADLIQRMQGIVLLGVFLKVTPFQKSHNLSDEELFEGIGRSLRKFFGKRGEQVITDNLNAVKRGFSGAIEIPRNIISASGKSAKQSTFAGAKN